MENKMLIKLPFCPILDFKTTESYNKIRIQSKESTMTYWEKTIDRQNKINYGTSGSTTHSA